MSDDSTKKPAPEAPGRDWSRFDAMSEDERHAAAADDPDARPVNPESAQHMRRTPQVRGIRGAPVTSIALSEESNG